MPRRARLHHSHRRHHLRGHGYFSRLGPGIVTGAADDDPSGIGTYSQVGAAFGFGLLWSLLFVAPMAAAVQETAGRLGLTSGRGLASLIRARFPRAVLLGAVVLIFVANAFNIGADVAAMAAAVRLVVPVPELALVVAITGALLALEILLPYHKVARVLRWLALSLLAYVVVLVDVDVDWSGVVHGLTDPGIPGGRTGLAALIAIFGTTVSPYLFFWQAAEEVEEEHEEGTGQSTASFARRHLQAMRVDVIGGMVSAVAIAFVIMVVSASTLHPAGITTVATAEQAADALRPIAGDLAGLVFAAGIVGLGLLAVPVLAGSSAYALAEAFAWNEGLSRTFRQARGFYLVLAVSMLSGAIVSLSGFDPIRALYYAAILNGLVAPPLIALMLVLGRDREVCGEHTSGWLSTTVVGATVAVSVALPVLYLVS